MRSATCFRQNPCYPSPVQTASRRAGTARPCAKREEGGRETLLAVQCGVWFLHSAFGIGHSPFRIPVVARRAFRPCLRLGPRAVRVRPRILSAYRQGARALCGLMFDNRIAADLPPPRMLVRESLLAPLRWCENPFSHPARGNPFPRVLASRRRQPPADPIRPRRATFGSRWPNPKRLIPFLALRISLFDIRAGRVRSTPLNSRPSPADRPSLACICETSEFQRTRRKTRTARLPLTADPASWHGTNPFTPACYRASSQMWIRSG